MDSAIIDCLSYIDHDVSESDREDIEKMIAEEFNTLKKEKYHPDMSTVLKEDPNSGVLQEQLQSLEQAEKKGNLDTSEWTMGGIDTTRFAYPPPNAVDEDSINRRKICLLYAELGLRSYKLMTEFERSKWLVCNEDLKQTGELLKAEVERKRLAVEECMSERKRRQLEAESTLTYLDQRWRESVRNCIEINVAIATKSVAGNV